MLSEGTETEANEAFSKGHPNTGLIDQGLNMLRVQEKTLKGRIGSTWMTEHVPLCKGQYVSMRKIEAK